ncbi:SDR family oxidoreductase [Opitutus sp. ER46]|uniref:SDR family oxidoreductase n=1 Tax=Opitutus sp. ER46 TaxID=2161864 RepID=UPI000D3283AF|nr:SDR family oxidoreductase [Opitutus sp. ER46]PTX97954.1 NAD(P)-dependent oxidoreductase [Opitutus sp. ER46]
MRIFITGASGLLGAALAAAAARAGHRVIGTRNRGCERVPGVAVLHALDAADEGAMHAALTAEPVDAIVNCAAVSSPPDCERDPAGSRVINVELPRRLAAFAAERGVRLVHVSSEQVFDGDGREPYAPGDAVAPRNVYGRQKVEAEQAVAELTQDGAAIVRPPLLVGDSLSGTRSLHEQLLAAWAAGQVPRLFTDEYRQPCGIGNLADVLLALTVRRDLGGVFHWAGRDLVSRYELAERIRVRFGLPAERAPLAPVTRAEVPAVAAVRPQYLALDVTALEERLGRRAQTLEAALAELYRR